MASEYEIEKWLWVNNMDADVILVNSDHEEYTANFTFDKPTQFKVRPILISCSLSGKKPDSFSYALKKPITYTMITRLLLQLEENLAAVAENSSTQNLQKLELNNNQQSTTSLLQKLFGYYRSQNDTNMLNSLDNTFNDSNYLSSHNNSIDDESDYDVYDLLLDSELCTSQPDISPILKPIAEHTTNVETKQSSDNSLKIEVNNKSKVPRRRFLEHRRLLGLLRKIKESGKSSLITHYKYPAIRVYPALERFAYKLPGDLSPDIFTAQASGFSIGELTHLDDQTQSNSWIPMPLWLLFYLATLYGSEGGLKDNQSPHDKLNLTSKPDFDLVPNDLEYLILADYMLNREPQDLNTIAVGSDIDIRTVIDFCNACEEIDILDRTVSRGAEIIVSKDIASNLKSDSSISDKNGVLNNSLLSRVMSKFKHTA
jgi:hypothetical protein